VINNLTFAIKLKFLPRGLAGVQFDNVKDFREVLSQLIDEIHSRFLSVVGYVQVASHADQIAYHCQRRASVFITKFSSVLVFKLQPNSITISSHQ
jgi:hypothetical protein